jgi:hypothetical protein
MTSKLPNQIPPQSAPLTYVDGNGQQVLDELWYLFLYGLWIQIATQSGGSIVLSPGDAIAMLEADSAGIDGHRAVALNAILMTAENDSITSARDAANAFAMAPEIEVSPVSRDAQNALMLATEGPAPDAPARAQPVATITLGASPFTFTATSNGTVAISGGNVSSLTLIRQGVSVPTGLIAAVIPVSRLDQIQITYLVAPTANFLPS